MKKCSKCGVVKPYEEFNRSSRNKDGYHVYCRECSKGHYQANIVRHKSNVRRTARARTALMQSILFEAMAGGCVDCGITDIRVLEFDHVRGVKVDSITSIVRRGLSIEVLLTEIAKCEIRCANCHTLATLSRLPRTWHDRYIDRDF